MALDHSVKRVSNAVAYGSPLNNPSQAAWAAKNQPKSPSQHRCRIPMQRAVALFWVGRQEVGMMFDKAPVRAGDTDGRTHLWLLFVFADTVAAV